MAQILDKQGLQHYANKMCNADNRKVGTKRLPAVLNEIDTAIDGFKHIFEQEYGNPVNMEITNKQNTFIIGTGRSIDEKNNVENSFTDLKLNGNSLVNIIKAKNVTLDASSDKTRTVSLSAATIQPSTQYTFIVFINSNTADSRLRMTTSPGYPFTAGVPIAELKKTGVFVTKLTSEASFDVKAISFNVNGGSGKVAFSCILLEGDHTTKSIPQYFEGLQSIGEKQDGNHKITIESANKNIILDSAELKNKNNEWKSYNGIVTKGYLNNVGYTIKHSGTNSYINSLEQTIYRFDKNTNKILPNTWYTLSFYAKGNSLRTHIYPDLIDINTKGIINGVETLLKIDGHCTHSLTNNWQKITYTFKTKSEPQFIQTTWNNLLFRALTNDDSVISCIMIEQGKIATEYKPQLVDNKAILLNEPLRGFSNGVKDTIEKINGEWKIIRRCGAIVLNGTENWTVRTECSNDKFTTFKINSYAYDQGNWISDGALLCDKMVKAAGYGDLGFKECIRTVNAGGHGFNISIGNNSLTSQREDSFKKWLSSNPLKVVYQLRNIIIEDIDPVTLQCWKNGTISIIDEVIPVETTHTVALNKSAQIQKNIEELTSLRNRVKMLEEQYNIIALNQAYETELLKLDMKLDNII